MSHPPSVAHRDSGTRWLLACGVGCGAFMLLAVLVVVGGYSAFRFGLNEAAGEFRTGLTKLYTELQEEERIPTEHVAVFDRIYQAAILEEASFWSTMMAMVVISGFTEDGEVTEEEAASAAKLADALESDPDMSLIEFAQFVEQNPEFEGAFNDAQRAFEDFQPGSDWAETGEEEIVPEETVQEEAAPEESELP